MGELSSFSPSLMQSQFTSPQNLPHYFSSMILQMILNIFYWISSFYIMMLVFIGCIFFNRFSVKENLSHSLYLRSHVTMELSLYVVGLLWMLYNWPFLTIQLIGIDFVILLLEATFCELWNHVGEEGMEIRGIDVAPCSTLRGEVNNVLQ